MVEKALRALERYEFDDLLGGIGKIGNCLGFFCDGGISERALGELVVGESFGGVHGKFDVHFGLGGAGGVDSSAGLGEGRGDAITDAGGAAGDDDGFGGEELGGPHRD